MSISARNLQSVEQKRVEYLSRDSRPTSLTNALNASVPDAREEGRLKFPTPSMDLDGLWGEVVLVPIVGAVPKWGTSILFLCLDLQLIPGAPQTKVGGGRPQKEELGEDEQGMWSDWRPLLGLINLLTATIWFKVLGAAVSQGQDYVYLRFVATFTSPPPCNVM